MVAMDIFYGFACWAILHAILSFMDFFFLINFFKKIFWNTIRVSNSLDPDQAKTLGLIWVQTICNGYQQKTKVTTSGERIKLTYMPEFGKLCSQQCSLG